MSSLKVIGNITYRKPKPWNHVNLLGLWHASTKIDGVRTFINTETGEVTSRNGKPLFNFTKGLIDELKREFPDRPVIDCETYRSNWETTISLVKTQHPTSNIVTRSDIYVLTDDEFDRRLNRGYMENPTSQEIKVELENVRSEGFEGLVLRQGYVWWKCKPTETHDVPILSVFEGKGKYKGTLGGFITPMGNVGTGFVDKPWDTLTPKMLRTFELNGMTKEVYKTKLRSYLWGIREELPGQLIEVQAIELTNKGMFRHPVYLRLREDK